MNEAEAREYVRQNHRGVLTTQMRNGRPQLSLVVYAVDDDGLIKISVRRPLAKTKNVRRNPNVSLAVLGDDFFKYVVVEGQAFIQDEDVIPTQRRVYERIQGKPHPDWADFDAAMVRDERCLVCIRPERMYPISD